MRISTVPGIYNEETAEDYRERLAQLYATTKREDVRTELINGMRKYVWGFVARKHGIRDDTDDVWLHVMMYGVIEPTDQYDVSFGVPYKKYIVMKMRYAIAGYYRDNIDKSTVANKEGMADPEISPICGTQVPRKVRSRRIAAPDECDEASVPDQCSQLVDDQHTAQTIKRVLAKLDPRYVEILRLRFYEDRSMEDAATIMHVSRRTAQQIYENAIAALKRYEPVISDAIQGRDSLLEQNILQLKRTVDGPP